jgi:hypothetical protein
MVEFLELISGFEAFLLKEEGRLLLSGGLVLDSDLLPLFIG